MAKEKKITAAVINKILVSKGFHKPETIKEDVLSGYGRISAGTRNTKSGDYYFHKDFKGNLYMEFDYRTNEQNREKITKILADEGIYLTKGKVPGRNYFSNTPSSISSSASSTATATSRGIGETKTGRTKKKDEL